LTGDILSGNGTAVLWAEAAIIIFYHGPTSRTTGQRIFMFVVAETNKQTKTKRDPSEMIPVRSRDYLSISCPNRDYVSVKSETNRAGINRADSIEIVQSD
jgi:hypothetical protein